MLEKFALIYGMDSEEFWFGNPQEYFVYLDAFAKKKQMEHDEMDTIGWLFGRYNLLAFSQVYSNAWGGKTHKEIFPREPISFKSTKNTKPKTAREAFERFKIIAEQYNR